MIHDDKPELNEDLLIHYGVVGMKWGVRRNTPDSSGVTRKQARQQIRTQNRQTRRHIEDFESSPNRSNQIRTARGQTRMAQRKYEDVKAEIKSQKSSGALGRNAARVMMNQARNERYSVIYKSEQTTAGERFVNELMDGLLPRSA